MYLNICVFFLPNISTSIRIFLILLFFVPAVAVEWNWYHFICHKGDNYHLHSYLSGFFISAGVPNGEFPEILIAKCRSRFYCT
jgi:phosphatidylglycerophosphate synthase